MSLNDYLPFLSLFIFLFFLKYVSNGSVKQLLLDAIGIVVQEFKLTISTLEKLLLERKLDYGPEVLNFLVLFIVFVFYLFGLLFLMVGGTTDFYKQIIGLRVDEFISSKMIFVVLFVMTLISLTLIAVFSMFFVVKHRANISKNGKIEDVRKD